MNFSVDWDGPGEKDRDEPLLTFAQIHERDTIMARAAFDAGWRGACDEVILVLETAAHNDETIAEAIRAIRELRDEE